MNRLLPLCCCLLVACGLPPQQQALLDVKAFIQKNLDALATDSQALCDAAPTPSGRGWDLTTDRPALDAMRAAWKKARPDYERVEGAIAVLFPEVDASIDERYDGFLEGAMDADLFDDQVVTGNHALERILFSDTTPQRVIDFEKALGARYVPARFPATEAEARDFKDKLCARWARETKQMAAEFKPLALDAASAYRGVLGSMREQVEKVEKAATGEEESRYSQVTLADMRANLEGAKTTYAAFRPWALSTSASAEDARIQAAFAELEATYAQTTGDAIPPVPTSWSNVNPSMADLATPFGQLFTAVRRAADDKAPGSLAAEMTTAGDKLGIPLLPAN
ncbi:MAG: EfeM/EfeO family lipoprotein [Myxococcus sp.]|nr:EfeM/EfeO family lipoprotein [Myxococcus sp.]